MGELPNSHGRTLTDKSYVLHGIPYFSAAFLTIRWQIRIPSRASVVQKSAPLGVDVPADKFVEAVKETGAKVLALSCLLNFAIQEMKHVVEVLTAANLRGQVRVIIGGQPIDDKIREYVGADDYGADAPAGVRVCREVYAGGRGCG